MPPSSFSLLDAGSGNLETGHSRVNIQESLSRGCISLKTHRRLLARITEGCAPQHLCETTWTIQRAGSEVCSYQINPGHISMIICHDILSQQVFLSTGSGTRVNKLKKEHGSFQKECFWATLVSALEGVGVGSGGLLSPGDLYINRHSSV